MNESCKSRGSHRRDFVRALAVGTAASVWARPSQSDTQDPPAEQPKAADRLDAEVDARMALIVARYGEKLDDAARKSIAAEVRSIVRRGKRLKAIPLDNGDGPFPIFVPYRGSL